MQKIEDKAEKGTISTKDIKDIVPDSQNVNGRQQAKIEKFLKQINVTTNAFKKVEVILKDGGCMQKRLLENQTLIRGASLF